MYQNISLLNLQYNLLDFFLKHFELLQFCHFLCHKYKHFLLMYQISFYLVYYVLCYDFLINLCMLCCYFECFLHLLDELLLFFHRNLELFLNILSHLMCFLNEEKMCNKCIFLWILMMVVIFEYVFLIQFGFYLRLHRCYEIIMIRIFLLLRFHFLNNCF